MIIHGLHVSRLVLTDFRGYAGLRMLCDARPVVLTGPNGAGKTNLLEALSLLAPGRGLRRATAADLPRLGRGENQHSWSVAVRLAGPDGEIALGTGREDGDERRLVRIDGRPARSQAALGEVLSLIWLTPAMDRLFQEGAGGRRRFLDRLVLNLDPAHTARASAYERALRDRSRLLREGRADPAWLSVLEETLATAGTAMAAARRALVGLLNAAMQDSGSDFPAATLALEGGVEAQLEEKTPAETEQWFRRTLDSSRRRDAESGHCLTGPHRTDLLVRHQEKDCPAGICSTGEQKALLVSVILGLARVRTREKGQAPLLLLDEVAAHLDRRRRAALFDAVCALPGHCWMSGTDAELFAELGERGQHFQVGQAQVTASPPL